MKLNMNNYNGSLVVKIAVTLLGWKETNSKSFAAGPPKNPVKKDFNKKGKELIIAVADYMNLNLKYVADPITFDYYTHPETVQYMINNNSIGKYSSTDCDDYACYAYKLLTENGYPKDRVSVFTVVPDLFPNITDIRWCHVLCLVDYNDGKPDGEGNYWKATIDTNGLHWFKYKEGQDWQAMIMKKFSEAYKTKYLYFLDHGYPF